MTTSEVLERAAELIEPDGAWTQHANAMNRSGRCVTIEDDEACAFCIHGAVWRVDGEDAAWEIVASSGSVLYQTIGCDPIDWNDAPGRTQREVVEALRAAALAARQETP